MSSHKKSKVTRSAKSQFRPQFELLENRYLLAGPEVDVLLGTQSLPVGETVDFGAAVEDSASRTRTFTVYNSGDKPLVLGSVNLPDGFRLKEGLSSTLRARARDTFTVEMTTDAIGVKSGDLWFSTNDADEGDCYFAISGEVTERVVGGPDIDVALVSRDMPTVWNGATADFGTANLRGVGTTLTFRVYNRGDQSLHLGTLEVPEGYRIANGLIRTVAPGRYDDFSIAMKTDSAGVKTGTVRFGSDAAGDETFEFSVQGEVVKSGRPTTAAAAMAVQAAATQRATVSKNPLVSSNPDWTWQSPTPPAQPIDQIYFLNSREGWMAAMGRGLLHTTDGGKSWSSVQFGPPMGFISVYFTDSQHGWAVGKDSDSWNYTETNLIWSTTDGGKTWHEQYREVGSALHKVVFTDNQTGWALDVHFVLATTDGGRSWNRITLPAEMNNMELADMQVVDSQSIWILGGRDFYQEDKWQSRNIVARSEDGGQTWSTSYIDGWRKRMWCLAVEDKANVWMAGDYGFIYRYDLNGNSWTEQQQPFGSDFSTTLVGMQFTSPIEGWAVTKGGGVLHTVDGGGHWLVNSIIPRLSPSGLVFNGPTNGWVYGAYGVLYQTTDGGLNWQNLRQGSASVLMSVSFPTASHGWTVGSEGAILSTKDSGKTWTAQASPVTTWLNGVHFVNSKLGWAVGAHGAILNTRDGGKHWNVQSSKSVVEFSAVYFATSKVGWVVGAGGTILNTQDGGTTWTPQNSNGNWKLTDVRFHDRLHGWATTSVNDEWPIVLRTDDGGANWTPVKVEFTIPASPNAPPRAVALSSVYFTSPTVGWMCGGFAVTNTAAAIFKTTDGGKTWELQKFVGKPLILQGLTAIWFVDKNRGFAVGENGLYLKTTDGGENWVMQDRACPGVYVTDIAFAGSRVGFMVGMGGTILKTTKAGR